MDNGHDLWSLFIKLNKLRATLMFAEMKSIGISGPQLLILRELFLRQPRTIGDLAKSIELGNSTVTGIVDRMESKGLVERYRDEKDRRIVWVRTTQSCMQVKKEKFERLEAQSKEEFLDLFSEEQRVLFGEFLEKTIVYLEKRLEETP